MVETFYYLLISNSSNCMYCNCLVTILDAWNSLKKFACYIVTDQVILVGGVGDWDRLDQVLPHCEIQRDANQDLWGRESQSNRHVFSPLKNAIFNWDTLRFIEIHWDLLRYIEIYWDILRLIEIYWDNQIARCLKHTSQISLYSRTFYWMKLDLCKVRSLHGRKMQKLWK